MKNIFAMNTQITSISVLLFLNALLIVYLIYSTRKKDKTSQMDEIKGQIQTINQNFFSYLQNKDQIYLKQFDSITASVGAQVSEMVRQMLGARDVFDKRLEQNGMVLADLQRNLGEISQISQRIFDVGRDVSSLQEVLKAPKLRGVLGETFLEEILSEILPADYYKMQYYFAGGEVADAALFLRSKILCIDSKFPLENFKKAFSAQEEESRASSLRKLFADVRKHIDAVSAKYIKTGENTFDCAFMYIPAENVYYELFIKNEEAGVLSQYAFKSKVIPVSPNTFYAYLQLVIFGLKGMQIEDNARKVLEQIISLKDLLLKFSDEFEILGKHITNTKNKYDESAGKLGDLSSRLSGLEQGNILPDEENSRIKVVE